MFVADLIKYFPQSEGSVMHDSNNWRRGFAAKASTQALEAIHSLSMKYVPTVEDDNIVTTQDEWGTDRQHIVEEVLLWDC